MERSSKLWIFHLFSSRDKDVSKDATSGGRASFYGGAHHFGRALLYRQMHESERNS